MPAITNVQCGDAYTPAATLGYFYDSPGGYLIVENQPATYSLASGPYGSEEWSEDYPAAVGSIAIGAGVIGVQVKNQTPGSIATVSAVLVFKGSPVPTPGAVGQATPAASSMITGIIPAAGTTQTAGTGFTYTHTNGTGVYVFTFTTPFANSPIVLCSQNQTSGRIEPEITALTASGFTVSWFNTVPAGADTAFMFIAQAVS